MFDYSNPHTPLTASKYTWSATATRPEQHGAVLTQTIDGTYTPPPGATVGVLLEGFRQTFSQQWGIPTRDIAIVDYSLREA